MSKAVAGKENAYFEMESKQLADAGIYEDVVGESAVPGTKQTTSQKQAHEKTRRESTEPVHSYQPDAMTVHRLLYIIAAVVAISFLAAVATLILALTIIMSRNTLAACTDCAALQELCRTSAVEKSSHIERIGRNSENITSVENRLEKKIQELTERLKSTELELKTIKSLQPSKTILVNELKDIWTIVNATAETTLTLTNKVNNISKMARAFGPPGFNGSQGATGAPGPKGDFSACQYKIVTATETPGDPTVTAVVAEPNGKRVVGVSCSTNFAAEYNLVSAVRNNVRRYACYCKGSSTLFRPFGGQQKSCYLHYWECPLTT